MDVKTVRPPYADASIIACSREGGPAKISAWNRRLPQIAERALPNACGETPNRSPFALKHLVALLFLLFASFGFSQIQGMVRDSATLTGVAGAIVRIQDSDVSTLTNADGSFTLNDSGAFPYRVVAAKYGYYNGSFLIINSGGLTDLNIEIEPLPTTVSPDHPLNSPEDCGGCHPDQYEDWVLSPMATTGLNRWVFDVYNGTGTPGGMNGFVYQRDSVHRFANPNSDCSACHSPVHWLTDIVNAGMGDINLPNTAMENGVQCEVCHRALDVDETKLNFPGVDPEAFTFLRGNYNLEFGLLGDATYENNIMRPAYNPQLSAQLCAACHEDNVDHDDDGDFEDPGSVPHETTFSEWEQYRALNGPNAETCVSCHMPAVSPPRFCVFGEPRQRPIRSHDIRGTTPEFLENAVTMTVDASVDLASLTVDVAILNDGAGHSVPTGVVIRNALLAVEAFDQDGQRLDLASGDVMFAATGVTDGAMLKGVRRWHDVAPAPVLGRYEHVWISDTGNADGYIRLRRCWTGAGWQTTVPVEYGVEWGWEDLSDLRRLLSGRVDVDVRPRCRTMHVQIEGLPEDEALVHAVDLVGQVGLSGQLYVLFDPTETAHAHRRSGIARLARLTPSQLAQYDWVNTGYQFIEEVA